MVVWRVGGCDEGVSEKRVVGDAAAMDEEPAGLGDGKTGQMEGGLGAMGRLPTYGVWYPDSGRVQSRCVFAPCREGEERERERERERENWYHACVAETKKTLIPLALSILWALR